jgi:Prenyltransferase and squalene oxidase repeat
VTDQQSELESPKRKVDDRFAEAMSQTGSSRQPASADAIAAGLEYLFSLRQGKSWSICRADVGQSAPWVTAYVLARLVEIPSHQISYARRQRIEESLDWLVEIRTPGGGWGFSGTGDDADSTAWAITALRQHGRSVPDEALEWVRRCHRHDGGFAADPETANAAGRLRFSAPDITAIAVRALASIDAPSSEFLASHLRTDLPGTPCRLPSKFFVSSTLLDWEPGMAPLLVVDAVRDMACQGSSENAWEQALLLRCATRLRMQSAWALAAGLRRLQRPDGSWPGSVVFTPIARLSAHQSGPHLDEQGVLATVTALSALAMGELQPGLYFGSDLPFRRL